jgi:hypothetical protein
MEYLIANCLLACSVGGLIWIIKSDDFNEFKVIFKLRLLGKGLCEILSEHESIIRVSACSLKTVDFIEGSEGLIEGRVVVFGPFNGVAKRILLLWKGDKHRCIRMDAVDTKDLTMDILYRDSLIEAKNIACNVFQKRKPKNHERVSLIKNTDTEGVDTNEPTAPIATTINPATSVVVEESASSLNAEGQNTSDDKGFIRRYVGKMISAKIEPHVKTGHDGTSEEYTAFTVTVQTKEGREQLTGNDLRRALSYAQAEAGNQLKLVHVKNKTTTNGFNKKVWEVVNLTKGDSQN